MNLVELTWKQIQALDRDTPVVFPIAAIEQHGHHLPVWTDSLLLGEIVKRVSERLPTQVLFAPLMWLGNSHHHLDFQGTLSAAPRTYLDLLVGLADNMLHHGFRRIVFLNGHGGNDVPGRQAIFELRQTYRQREDLLLLMGTYWSLGTSESTSAISFQQTEMGHACEWETSMVMRIAPHLVGDYQSADPIPHGRGFEPGNRGWVTQDRSDIGHIGWPQQASIQKGEALFDRFSNDVTRWLERVINWDGSSWDG
jgi:creatinine amidohydrolase